MTAIYEEGARRSFGTVTVDTNPITIYTCPTGVTTAYVTWLNASDDAADARTLTLTWTDASAAVTYTLGYQLALAANTPLRIELDLCLDAGDTLSATGSASGIHIAVTVKEVARRKV